MKKIMILVIASIVLASCQRSCAGGADPYPPGTDWSLSIVKFKQPEYKDYIIARKWTKIGYIDSTGKSYFKDTVYYGMNQPLPLYLDSCTFSWSLDELQNIWLPLNDDYYLCCWKWTILFDAGAYGEPYLRYLGWSSYPSFNCKNNKEVVDNVFLMKDKWVNLLDIFTSATQNKIDTFINYDWMLYTTTDVSKILCERPLAEHYVVTAKSLYSFTNSHYTKQDEIFMGYEPAYMNPGLVSTLRTSNIELSKPLQEIIENSSYIESKWEKERNIIYDSLFANMKEILKDVVESGRLQEYLDYDADYNKNWCSVYNHY